MKYLREIRRYAMQDCSRKITYPTTNILSLMQRTLFVCPFDSYKEDIAADSLALAEEDMLASAFNLA
jgi:hypothetical protein